MGRLEKKEVDVAHKLKGELSSVSDLAITHDGWTSINTESFYTTTVHFIDNNWVLQNGVPSSCKSVIPQKILRTSFVKLSRNGHFLCQWRHRTTLQMNKRHIRY